MKRLLLPVLISLIALGAKAPTDPAHFVSSVTKSREQFVFNVIPPLESIEFSKLTAFTGEGGLWAFNCPNLTTVALPKATSVTLNCGGNAQLSSVQLPALREARILAISGSEALESFNAPLLVSATSISIRNNHNLTSVSVPLLTPSNGMVVDFYDNALDQASVDLILQRCVLSGSFVSGSVALNGGMNSAPSITGMGYVNTLLARGISIAINQ